MSTKSGSVIDFRCGAIHTLFGFIFLHSVLLAINVFLYNRVKFLYVIQTAVLLPHCKFERLDSDISRVPSFNAVTPE